MENLNSCTGIGHCMGTRRGSGRLGLMWMGRASVDGSMLDPHGVTQAMRELLRIERFRIKPSPQIST